MSDDEQVPPWYGVDDETEETYFGPIGDRAVAQAARDAHERREHIELRRQPSA